MIEIYLKILKTRAKQKMINSNTFSMINKWLRFFFQLSHLEVIENKNKF